MLNLIDSFGKKGVSYGLYSLSATVNDTDYLSKYFVVSEFSPIFTGGKNSFSFNGSNYLKSGSQIYVECIDSAGDNLYIEMATYSNQSSQTFAYKESTAFVFSIYVYGDTADGVGKLMLYGTLIDGTTVKWMQNITINKTLSNVSRVRFYQPPVLEVESADIPVLSSDTSLSLVSLTTFSGVIQGLAVTPAKDTNVATINKRTTDIDYQLTVVTPSINRNTLPIQSLNSQMVGSTVTLYINSIQQPLTQQVIPVSQTASYVISNVLDNNTLQISTPYYASDSNGNQIITNINNANFTINYPFVNYNNATASYETTVIGGVTYGIFQSYADITYRNLRTFSGYAARHKIYRRSLLSNEDFTVVADEPITVNEGLIDNITQNVYYEDIGIFYNPQHIQRYWFTSSNHLSLISTPDYAINSMQISSSTYTSLSGSDYVMVKNDSVASNRNAQYVPFNMDQFLEESGSAYDSNFISLKANVQYIIEVTATIIKKSSETTAGLSFYFTSSIPSAKQEPNFNSTFGVLLTQLNANQTGSSINFQQVVGFYTPQSDLYGTMVIVPKLCEAYLENLSFRVYGDDGFSPDVFSTTIPWPVSVANESFQIKAELFDINSSLIYSDLQTFQNFDPSGSSLTPYIPGGSNYKDLHVSGTLYVSESAIIQFGTVYIPNIPPRPGVPAISQSRILSVRADGALVFDPLVDVTSDSSYLYVSTGDGTNRQNTPITTKKSLASDFGTLGGRKIFWVTGSKQIQTLP